MLAVNSKYSGPSIILFAYDTAPARLSGLQMKSFPKMIIVVPNVTTFILDKMDLLWKVRYKMLIFWNG